MKNNNNAIPEILFLVSFISLFFLFHILYKKYSKIEERAENVFSEVCETCQGKGETKQKTSDLIYAGRFYMFMNSHKPTCSECRDKGLICNEAKKKLEYLRQESKEKEKEETLMYSCPDCFGRGKTKNYKQ